MTDALLNLDYPLGDVERMQYYVVYFQMGNFRDVEVTLEAHSGGSPYEYHLSRELITKLT